MKSQIKAYSGALLEVVPYDTMTFGRYQTIQVVHQSVKDFFTNGGLAVFATLNCGIPTTIEQCHGSLYRTCLRYISNYTLLPLKAHYLDPAVTQMDPWMPAKWRLRDKFPLMDYACGNLFVHAARARNQRGVDLQEENRMLGVAISNWCGFQYALADSNHKHIVLSTSTTTTLDIAAFAGLTDLVNYILQNVKDVTAAYVDQQGCSALHFAIEGGHLGVAEILVAAGTLTSVNRGGRSLPEKAARNADMQCFNRLMDQGVDLSARNADGETPLYSASEKGHSIIVKLCIENGADVNSLGGKFAYPLQAASAVGSEKAVRLLIDAGADVNALGGFHGHALVAASAQGSEQIVRLLIEGGANVNAGGPLSGFDSPLRAACEKGSIEVVRLLINAGADLTRELSGKFNILTVAACSDSPEVVRFLIELGADINAPGTGYGSALQAASAHGNQEIVRLLIEAGADINASGGQYGTALRAATTEDCKEIVRLLIEKGADVNLRGGVYGSALTNVRNNYRPNREKIIKMLVDAGAEL